MDKEKARAGAVKGGRLLRQHQGGNSPAEEQLKLLFSKPCIIRWSDGSESQAVLGDVFYTEEAYDRYNAYKESGKPYPVEIHPLADAPAIVFPEDPGGERELYRGLCDKFTGALRQIVGGNTDPLQIAQDATEIFNRQAEEAQRELQRQADEAQDAISGGAKV